MTRLQKYGVAAIALPAPLLIVVLIGFSVLRFLATLAIKMDTTNDNPTIYVIAAANALLGLIGVLLVIAIPVGLIVGVVLLIVGGKQTPTTNAPKQ